MPFIAIRKAVNSTNISSGFSGDMLRNIGITSTEVSTSAATIVFLRPIRSAMTPMNNVETSSPRAATDRMLSIKCSEMPMPKAGSVPYEVAKVVTM